MSFGNSLIINRWKLFHNEMQCLHSGAMTTVLQDVVPLLWFMIYKVRGSLLSMESVYSSETVVTVFRVHGVDSQKPAVPIQSYVGDASHAQTDFTSNTADMRRLQLASGMLQFARNQPYTSRGLAVERNNTQTKACNSFTVTSLQATQTSENFTNRRKSRQM